MTLLAEWELFFGSHNLTFAFLDPENRVVWTERVTVKNSQSGLETVREVLHLLPGNFHKPMSAGLWKLIVLNQGQVVGALRYVIAQSAQLEVSRTFSAPASNWTTTSYERNAVSAFMREQPSFFAFKPNQTSLWNVHSVCFEVATEDYTWKCNNSFEIPACSDVSWSLGAVRSRYLLASQ